MRFQICFLVFSVLIGLSSCVPYERLVNFNEGDSFDNLNGGDFEVPELKVQADDILHINVQSWDVKAAAPFNVSAELIGDRGPGNAPSEGYLVKSNGEISFPVLGAIKVEGLTTKVIRDTLISRLKPYLVDASVNVRVVNFKISVLGEVYQPGTIVLQEEQVTILEALSYVGDLTSYANLLWLWKSYYFLEPRLDHPTHARQYRRTSIIYQYYCTDTSIN